jgi:hypothetical protein
MMYVNFSQYLSDKGVDISDYAGLSVTFQLKDAEGNDVSETDASYGKVALAPSADLNGWAGGVKAGWMTDKAGETKEVLFSDIEAADLATVAGFNLQVEKTAADQHYVITAIKLIGK